MYSSSSSSVCNTSVLLVMQYMHVFGSTTLWHFNKNHEVLAQALSNGCQLCQHQIAQAASSVRW
eukprot:1473-Heterococcus_DN1.PRE.3